MTNPVQTVRRTKRDAIASFFSEHIGERFCSAWLHGTFGSAFRSRVSELNRIQDFALVICNEVEVVNGEERSVYWAKFRDLSPTPEPGDLFPDFSERHCDDN